MRQGIRSGKVTGINIIRKRRADGSTVVYHYAWRGKGAPCFWRSDSGIAAGGREYVAALHAALQGRPDAKPPRGAPGSLAALCGAVVASAAYARLSEAYAGGLRKHLDAIAAEYGHVSARAVQEKHIRADVGRDTDQHKRLKAWRFIYSTAIELGLADTNPAAPVRKPRAVQTDGYAPWTVAEIEAFRAKWQTGTPARACFELVYWTGARVSDAAWIGPQHVRDGMLVYRQNKTGKPAYVPWSCPLPGFAVEMAADRLMMHAALPGGHLTFLPTCTGAARSVRGLGQDIRRWAAAAGVQKSAHGLRKARAVALAEAGATTMQIAAWTGHQSIGEVERYTRAAAREKLVRG